MDNLSPQGCFMLSRRGWKECNHLFLSTTDLGCKIKTIFYLFSRYFSNFRLLLLPLSFKIQNWLQENSTKTLTNNQNITIKLQSSLLLVRILLLLCWQKLFKKNNEQEVVLKWLKKNQPLRLLESFPKEQCLESNKRTKFRMKLENIFLRKEFRGQSVVQWGNFTPEQRT